MEQEIIEMKNIVNNELTVQHDTIICEQEIIEMKNIVNNES